MIKPHLVIVVLMLLFCGSTHAQSTAEASQDTLLFNQLEDLVVTNAGDTIPCETKKPLWGTPRYRSSNMADFKKIDIKDIKYYTLKNKKERYKAVMVPWPLRSKPEYLELVQDGKITLYRIVVYSGGYMSRYSVTTWFISKGNDQLKELKTTDWFGSTSRKKRKGIFAEMLADQPDVLKKYEETNDFSFKTLSEIVYLYNTGKPLLD